MYKPKDMQAYALERFQRDTKNHELTVLHDDGLYRHLRFRRPRDESSSYWFDLITWPGMLCVNGDMGTYTFARLADMFEFFRSPSQPKFHINASYWAEKSKGSELPLEEYDSDHFAERIREYVKEGGAEFGDDLMYEVELQILEDEEFNDEHLAVKLVRDFAYTTRIGGSVKEFTFPVFDGFCENMRDWSFHYLWNCHAIQWGIWHYDQMKAATA